MMKTIISNISIVLAIGLLTACTNQDYSTVGGAAIGGLAGNAITGGSTAGTIVGAVGGGYIGNQLGQ